MKHTTSAQRLAAAFCQHLETAIGAKNVRRAATRNKLPAYAGCCATHDFCDANEVMATAFKEVTLREADTTSDGDLDLFNAAWNIAKANGLQVSL